MGGHDTKMATRHWLNNDNRSVGSPGKRDYPDICLTVRGVRVRSCYEGGYQALARRWGKVSGSNGKDKKLRVG